MLLLVIVNYTNAIFQLYKTIPKKVALGKLPCETHGEEEDINSSACKLFPVQEHVHVCNPDVSVLSAVLQVAAVALMRSNMCMEAGPGLGGALLTPKGKESPVICGVLE